MFVVYNGMGSIEKYLYRGKGLPRGGREDYFGNGGKWGDGGFRVGFGRA